jgi:hypothetical protein
MFLKIMKTTQQQQQKTMSATNQKPIQFWWELRLPKRSEDEDADYKLEKYFRSLTNCQKIWKHVVQTSEQSPPPEYHKNACKILNYVIWKISLEELLPHLLKPHIRAYFRLKVKYADELRETLALCLTEKI